MKHLTLGIVLVLLLTSLSYGSCKCPCDAEGILQMAQIKYNEGEVTFAVQKVRWAIKLLEDNQCYLQDKFRAVYVGAMLDLASMLEESDEGTPIEIEYLRRKAYRFNNGWNN